MNKKIIKTNEGLLQYKKLWLSVAFVVSQFSHCDILDPQSKKLTKTRPEDVAVLVGRVAGAKGDTGNAGGTGATGATGATGPAGTGSTVSGEIGIQPAGSSPTNVQYNLSNVGPLITTSCYPFGATMTITLNSTPSTNWAKTKIVAHFFPNFGPVELSTQHVMYVSTMGVPVSFAIPHPIPNFGAGTAVPVVVQLQAVDLDSNGQIISNSYTAVTNLVGAIPYNYRGRPTLTGNNRKFNISGNVASPILYMNSGTALQMTLAASNIFDIVQNVAAGTGEADLTVAAGSATLTATGSVVKFSAAANGPYLDCVGTSNTNTAVNNAVTLFPGQRTLMKLNFTDNSSGTANRYALVELVSVDSAAGVAAFKILEDVLDYGTAATIDWKRFTPN
jgi:hypothetical protein